MQGECAFHTNPVGNFPHREGFGNAASPPLDDDAFEHLNPFALTFDHLDVHADGVTRLEIGDIASKLLLRHFPNNRMHVYPSFHANSARPTEKAL